MKGREESVSKKGIEAIGRLLITRGFGGKIGRGGLRRRLCNEIGRVFFFYLAFSSGWTIQLGGRYKIQCPVLREKGGREGGRAR